MNQYVLEKLNRYLERFPEEISAVSTFLRFVKRHPDVFHRSCRRGHITASGWILSTDLKQVLLVHHRKLGLWVQPGGHCDGDTNALRVSKKEIEEEVGLRHIDALSEDFFDIDIHPIPEYGDVPAHHHFDVRFAWIVRGDEDFQINHEVRSAKWFSVEGILKNQYMEISEDSIRRMARKTQGLTRRPVNIRPVNIMRSPDAQQ